MRRLLAAAVAATALAGAAPAAASPDLESTFQDDDHLVYTTREGVQATLDRLAALGVDRVRATVLWRHVAPDRESRTRPAGFDAADPARYPQGIWDNYDNLVIEAARRGIGVNLNVTGPSPTWANEPPPQAGIEDNYEPDPGEFGAFVRAVGARYSGSYAPPDKPGTVLPRVDYWSVWNEPNHSGWLTPQWRDYAPDKWVERSPSLYRELLAAAWQGLAASGHAAATDTILIGETAPTGSLSKGYKRYLTALRFVRIVYCVDRRFRPFRGSQAERLGCPADPSGFAAANPALFVATGWAHHPYNLLAGPKVKPADRDHANIATLGRLTRTLDRAFRAHGRRGRYPLFLTEFGYQTKPDPVAGAVVSYGRQAAWLNQSEYMAWRHPRSRTLAQFLLYDDGEPISLTFQSGLLTRSGKAKPALAAYRLPVWQVRRRGSRVKLWGRLRPAPDGAPAAASVQRKRGTRWRTLRRVRTSDPRNFWVATVRARRKAKLRVVYEGNRSRVLRVR